MSRNDDLQQPKPQFQTIEGRIDLIRQVAQDFSTHLETTVRGTTLDIEYRLAVVQCARAAGAFDCNACRTAQRVFAAEEVEGKTKSRNHHPSGFAKYCLDLEHHETVTASLSSDKDADEDDQPVTGSSSFCDNEDNDNVIEKRRKRNILKLLTSIVHGIINFQIKLNYEWYSDTISYLLQSTIVNEKDYNYDRTAIQLACHSILAEIVALTLRVYHR